MPNAPTKPRYGRARSSSARNSFHEIIEHPIPLDMNTLRSLKRSQFGLPPPVASDGKRMTPPARYFLQYLPDVGHPVTTDNQFSTGLNVLVQAAHPIGQAARAVRGAQGWTIRNPSGPARPVRNDKAKARADLSIFVQEQRQEPISQSWFKSKSKSKGPKVHSRHNVDT